MKKNSMPEIIAIRAVNQYRRRDILSYLSLRYYVENLAARTDYWANHAAIDLTLTKTKCSFFATYHFKEVNSDNEIKYREVLLPTANEALAETALLYECSKHSAFSNHKTCVFSYNLSDELDKSGPFKPYIIGLRERQSAIAKACEEHPTGIVRHTDIKRFYPSISLELASRIWEEKCIESDISRKFRLLGRKLIESYDDIEGNNSLPIGPAFCHFLANMVLKELDTKFSMELPANYFRYVDDITLVGEKKSVDISVQIIRDNLSSLGLMLHEDASPKNIQGQTSEWINYRNDFNESRRAISWKTLIGDLRRFLLLHPEKKDELSHAFLSEGFRIPLYDYIITTKDKTFLERFISNISNLDFRLHNRNITVQSLLKQCRFLRNIYLEEISSLISNLSDKHDFDRKSRIPKIRYRASRLLYLASKEQLIILSKLIQNISELYFHRTITDAIISKNVDIVLTLGPNCAQATAQLFKAEKSSATTNLKVLTPIQQQGAAIFQLHSIQIQGCEVTNSNFFRFASIGCDDLLIKCEDAYIRELSCLHGIQRFPRHNEILNSIFDEDEDLAFDAVDQMQESLSP